MSTLDWVRRAEALPAAGIVCTGAAKVRLLVHLGTVPDTVLARLTFVATRDLLVLIGATADLPWVDGARYCAPDPVTHALWLPTTVAPALPADLLHRSAGSRVGEGAVLLWNEPELFMPLADQRALAPDLLAWLRTECA